MKPRSEFKANLGVRGQTLPQYRSSGKSSGRRPRADVAGTYENRVWISIEITYRNSRNRLSDKWQLC